MPSVSNLDERTAALTRVSTTTDMVNLLQLAGLSPGERSERSDAKKGFPFTDREKRGPAPLIENPPHKHRLPHTAGSLTVFCCEGVLGVQHHIRLLMNDGITGSGGPQLRYPDGTGKFNANVMVPPNNGATVVVYYIEVGLHPNPGIPEAPENEEHQRHRIKILVMPQLRVTSLTGNPIPPGPAQPRPLPVTLTARATGGAPPYRYLFKDNGVDLAAPVGPFPEGVDGPLNTQLNTPPAAQTVTVTVIDDMGTEAAGMMQLVYVL